MKNALLILMLFGILACENNSMKKQSSSAMPKPIQPENFSKPINGKNVQLFSLVNKNNFLCEITNYGGRVVSLWTPDKNGNFEDIVLGYNSLGGYLSSNEIYYGALIGRYGNRIANGKFTLNDVTYSLAQNNEKNHLHGGINGFNNVVWDTKQINPQQLELTYLSPSGEEGYPGNLSMKVIYTLTDNDELKIEYWAKTDQPTPVNLTHHSFFNLKGAGEGDIMDHSLQINSDFYVAIDSALIPTGKLESVKNSPMDFNVLTMIGKRIDTQFEQLKLGKGYDHCWVLKKENNEISFAARVEEKNSGRWMEVYTNEPGMQFYSGNFLDGSDIGKKGKTYGHRSAFCLETQHFPDSPNQKDFPNTILQPGEKYHSLCLYKFGTFN